MSIQIYDLTHNYEQFMPEWPSSPCMNLTLQKFHANNALYELKWEGSMHRGTHMDAPIHVTENTPGITDYPLWQLCGTGVCISIPKDNWGVITPEDLERATPKIQKGDIVMINTGFHHRWADTDDYFGFGCGINGAGADWLVAHEIKMVGYSCQANDHPMATKLVDHGLGPTQPHLIEEYKARFGRDPKDDFPLWEDGHKNLMVKGHIPGIENIGGQLDEVTGKRCYFMAFPIRWDGGDGSIVRVIAICDPEQEFRFGNGT
ncbi:MAG: cyclase family protein [Oscillospiraceae bacterium]|nr:cyclase family protein [Oscillospiraceae bacterium]